MPPERRIALALLFIAPALWIERGLRQPLAIAGALAAAFAGLALSWGLDMASGPTVALAMTAFGLGSLARTRMGRELVHRERTPHPEGPHG